MITRKLITSQFQISGNFSCAIFKTSEVQTPETLEVNKTF
jgi:hypothetical protein